MKMNICINELYIDTDDSSIANYEFNIIFSKWKLVPVTSINLDDNFYFENKSYSLVVINVNFIC